MPDQAAEGIKLFVSGAIGSLLATIGITRSLMSKAACNGKQAACIKTVDTKLSGIAEDITEIKEVLKKFNADFYVPR